MGPALTPMVRNLLITLVVVFGLQMWLEPTIEIHFALWSLDTDLFRPWQIVTSAFLHGGWVHLAVNSMVLYSFGPPLENLLGSTRFGIYFLASAIGGSVLQLMAQSWGFSPADYSLGASAGTSGLLLAFALAYPRHKMVIFPIPVPLSAWICVSGFAVMSLIFALTGWVPGIGHVAHLGGMLGGLLLTLYWRAKVRR